MTTELKHENETATPDVAKEAKPAKEKKPAKAKKAAKPEKKATEPKAEGKAKAAKAKPTVVVTNDPNMKWYVLQTQSNYEKRVQASVREQAMMQKLDHLVVDVLIPTEEVIEVKKGVKVKSERKFFPGYVLVRANMTDEVWHLLKNIPHVTNFVGSNRGKKPLPISDKEADRMLKQMVEGVDKPRPMINFEVGEQVRVTEGPFASFQGMVEEIDEDRSRLKVSVSIFGRATPIELDFVQVEKC